MIAVLKFEIFLIYYEKINRKHFGALNSFKSFVKISKCQHARIISGTHQIRVIIKEGVKENQEEAMVAWAASQV